jgi:hypothetical protein
MANRNPPDVDLGKKPEAAMPGITDPDYQLPVYQGETKKRAMAKPKSARAEAMRRRIDADKDGV